MGSDIFPGISLPHYIAPPSPLMDDTVRCFSFAVSPTQGTMAPFSHAPCLSAWRPGCTTTRETPAGRRHWARRPVK